MMLINFNEIIVVIRDDIFRSIMNLLFYIILFKDCREIIIIIDKDVKDVIVTVDLLLTYLKLS